MIKSAKILEKFEKALTIKEKVNVKKNFLVLEALYREAVNMGVFPLKNTLDGIKIDIKIAKVVNSVSKTS